MKKSKNDDQDDSSGVRFEVMTDIVSNAVEHLVKTIAIAAVGYIVVDTARQVTVKWATTRAATQAHTPQRV